MYREEHNDLEDVGDREDEEADEHYGRARAKCEVEEALGKVMVPWRPESLVISRMTDPESSAVLLETVYSLVSLVKARGVSSRASP